LDRYYTLQLNKHSNDSLLRRLLVPEKYWVWTFSTLIRKITICNYQKMYISFVNPKIV
jgi:hypothetical protein